jgi:hypothetical protein
MDADEIIAWEVVADIVDKVRWFGLRICWLDRLRWRDCWCRRFLEIPRFVKCRKVVISLSNE